MSGLVFDLRASLRHLRRHRGTAIVAILTLALGIGGTTAIFSVVKGVLLDPPPFSDPDRLVALWHRWAAADGRRLRIPAPDAALYEAAAPSLDGLAFVLGAEDDVMDDGGSPQHLRVGVATPNLFDVLGVEAEVGRVFRDEEAVLSAAALADTASVPAPGPILLTASTWRSRFGSDAAVVGRTVRVGGAPATIVGVLPETFELLLPPGTGFEGEVDAWTPLRRPLTQFERVERLEDQDSDNSGAVVARLAPGATLAGLESELEAIAARQRRDVPLYAEGDLRVVVERLRDGAVAHVRPAILALMGAVGFVLFIACINVANLLLARSAYRTGEMAVRAAIGASRFRLGRLVLVEGFVLALLGAAAGTGIAVWGIQAILAWAPDAIPRTGGIGLDAGVLAFTLVGTSLAAIGFSSAPAWRARRSSADDLRAGGPRGGGSRRARLRRGLVVVEVALSFALLVGAGLMLRTSARLQTVDPGFEAADLLTFRLRLVGAGLGGPAARARFADALERRIGELPGVTSVGVTGGLPLGGVVWTQPYGLDGAEPGTGAPEANFRVVTAGYFDAMGTRLLAGRAFSRVENLVEEQRVAIVDATLARRVSADGDAVGRSIRIPLDGSPVDATIVGVVEDVRFDGLRSGGEPTIYVPYRQEASRSVTVAVRAPGAGPELAGRIEAVVRGLGTGTPVPPYDVQWMATYVDRALAPTRFALRLIGIFAIVALGLATVGLAGLVSYTVSRRTREFGLRMALGARARDILGGVLRDGLVLSLAGVGVGLLLALASARALSGILYGVGPGDVITYAAAAVALLAATTIAGWLPARRAARVEPTAALRED